MSVGAPSGPGSRPTGRASKAVSPVPASIPSAGGNIGQLIDKFAVHEFRKTADTLEALSLRLGRDGLSMAEWNALVGAAHYLRIDAWRRERSAAQAIEARRVETERLDAEHESAVPQGCAQDTAQGQSHITKEGV